MNRTPAASSFTLSRDTLPQEASKSVPSIPLETIYPQPGSSGAGSRRQSSLGLSDSEHNTEASGYALPPVDGGFGAWSFVSRTQNPFGVPV